MMSKIYPISLAALALACANAGSPAAAQTEEPGAIAAASLQPRISAGRQIYDAAQFSRFNPRNALDMVEQVPGFIIDTGDDDERGLGQADENVLINGARIPGKNADAETVLSRISADQVLRIEIVDGATLPISGLSGQILNLITKTEVSSGISGNFSWRPRWRRAGNNWLEGEAAISGRLGDGTFTLAVENNASRNGNQGPETVVDDDGVLLFRRDEVARFRTDKPKISAAYSRTSAAGSLFNINGEYEIDNFREANNSLRTRAGSPDIIELFTRKGDDWNAELSADYAFDLGGGRLKLIALQRLKHDPSESFFGQTFTDGSAPNGSRFDRTTDEGESVLRAEYGWQTQGGSDWGINLEGAYNFLDSTGALFRLNAQGLLQPIPLTNADSKVTEYRGELIGSFGRPLSDRLTIQTTLGGEYSQISQSGALGTTRSFIRPKGSVSLAWRPQDDLDISLKVERLVGQLDFSDFVESVDVSANANNAGNPDLVPPQSWRAELEASQNLGPFGSMTVNIYGEKFSDIVDSIPITETTEAKGNLPSATSYGVEAVSSLLLDPLGWSGAKLDLEGEVRKSSVRDPLSFIKRRITGDKIFSYKISLRHDVPRSDWAWGLGVEDDNSAAFFRLDRLSDFIAYGIDTWVFVEHKNIAGLTVTARLDNLLNSGEGFTRTVFGSYDPDTDMLIPGRRNGPIAFIEDRRRTSGLIYRLTVSGNF